MRTRLMRTGRYGAVMAMPAMALVLAVSAGPSSAAESDRGTGSAGPAAADVSVRGGAPCGSYGVYGPGDHDKGENIHVTKSKVPLRTGSGPSCPAQTTLVPSDDLDPYCYVYAPSNGDTWTYVRWDNHNPARDREGWVNDDHLQGNGSPVDCPEF